MSATTVRDLQPQDSDQVDGLPSTRPLELAQPIQRLQFFIEEIFTGAVNLITKINPVIGQELTTLLTGSMGDSVKKFIIANGQNSIETTASLMTVMLAEIPTAELEHFKEYLQRILAHHLLEVVLDQLDAGSDMSDERLKFLIKINHYAYESAGGSRYELGGAELQTPGIADNIVGEAIKAKLADKGFPTEGLQITSIKLSELIEMSLRANSDIADFLDSTQTRISWLDDSIKDALQGRYREVINTATIGYQRMNLPQALATREGSILIKATMLFLIRGMVAKDNNIYEFVNENQDSVMNAVAHTARLVGIWNDAGTKLMRMNPQDIEAQFAYLQAQSAQPVTNMRDLIAPASYRTSLADSRATTSDYAQMRVLNDAEVEMWRDLAQLLKDAAAAERNIVFDTPVEPSVRGEIYDRVELLKHLSAYSQNLEVTLGKMLIGFPPALASLIRNVALFHSQLYGDGRDYYGNRRDGTALPVVNGMYQEGDDRLMGL